MRRASLLFAVLLSAVPLFAHEIPFSISPASAPTEGGTTVTVKGNFAEWPYTVIFGDAPAKSTTRVDEHTLVAVTPAHLPGRVDITIFEYDIFLATDLTFDFIGNPPVAQFERILLPVLAPPVPGAFGSEFRTALRVMNTSDKPDALDVFGLTQNCVVLCVDPEGDPVQLPPFQPLGEEAVIYLGKPGRFIYLVPEQSRHFSANLRVYDTSRAAENFGTAIPIVRHSQFRTTPFALVGVPTDPRFRNTLRLYSTSATTVQIAGLDEGDTRLVALTGGSLYEPAYAQISFSGTQEGLKNLVITPADGGPAVWGFVSVTNNVTQHITTISPR